jgi:hypothetical protein
MLNDGFSGQQHVRNGGSSADLTHPAAYDGAVREERRRKFDGHPGKKTKQASMLPGIFFLAAIVFLVYALLTSS